MKASNLSLAKAVPVAKRRSTRASKRFEAGSIHEVKFDAERDLRLGDDRPVPLDPAGKHQGLFALIHERPLLGIEGPRAHVDARIIDERRVDAITGEECIKRGWRAIRLIERPMKFMRIRRQPRILKHPVTRPAFPEQVT